MMNYEIFKEVVKDSFKDYLPEQYKDMELRVCSVNKVNRMMDGINLIGGSEVKNVSPTMRIFTVITTEISSHLGCFLMPR